MAEFESLEEIKARYPKTPLKGSENSLARWVIDDKVLFHRFKERAIRIAKYLGLTGATITAIKIIAEYIK